MDRKDRVAEAKTEFDELGTFTTTTYMDLNNNGINADILLAQFETEGADNG